MLSRVCCIFAQTKKQMEYDIKKLDCGKMRIHPQSPKLVSYLESNIPQIKSLEIEFQDRVFTRSMVYRYVILMYENESPVQKRHSLDWFAKKYEACAYAGFQLKKGRDGYVRFDPRVDDMVFGRNEAINDLIISFLGWTNNVKWNYLVFLQESMLNFTRDALGKKQTDVKTSKEFRELYDRFHQLSNEIGHTFDETEEFVSRFYYQIEQSRLAIRPEDFSEAIARGDDFRADNPYGVSFEHEKIRFLGDDEEHLSL